MHPTIAYKVNRARTAELRGQAQRDHLARGARRGRRPRWRQLTDHLPAASVMAARRLLIRPGVSLAGNPGNVLYHVQWNDRNSRDRHSPGCSAHWSPQASDCSPGQAYRS